MTQIKNTKKITCLQIIPSMGIGGIETGVRDIAKYLNKKKIDNYILCENSNKNFNVKGLKIIASPFNKKLLYQFFKNDLDSYLL